MITCNICGQSFWVITNAHLAKHGIKTSEYKGQLVSNATIERRLQSEHFLECKRITEEAKHIEKRECNVCLEDFFVMIKSKRTMCDKCSSENRGRSISKKLHEYYQSDAGKQSLERRIYTENDCYTPFRWFLRCCKRREKSSPFDSPKSAKCNLTLEYLKEVWESQNGICPITGWQIILPDCSDGWTSENNIRRASLDRIDNSFGYVRGNVRFVAVIFNYGRNHFSDQQVIDFCKTVIAFVDGNHK